jgi:two-component system, OmpR family, heavy metal sensor histidine kinase CusS
MCSEGTRRRPLSMALRITAVLGIVMTVIFVGFTARVVTSMESHFAEQDLGELQAVADSLTSALGPAPSADDPRELERRLSRAVAGHHGVYFNVSNAAGGTLFGTAPQGLLEAARSAPAAERIATDALRIWQAGGTAYRGAMLRIRGESVLVAVSMQPHLRYLAELRRALWWGTAFACVVAVLAAWLAVRWGHAPLRRISATVRGVTSEQLHLRLSPSEVPVELDPLVTSFNEMLDQLQTSFARLTHFSADIAHELRTPMTNLTTQTQVALSKARSPEAYREVLYSSLEELEHMGKMIGDMLYLAQSEHRLSRPEVSDVDLAGEVRALFDYFEAWAEEVGVELSLAGPGPAVRGDRSMLRRALGNLIANALRYMPRGRELSVTLSTVGSSVEVAVANPGPDIPAEHLPHLFDRFYRVDPARQHKGDGVGLGLAIVKSIIEAHGGKVRVESSAGLTRFCLVIPMAGPPEGKAADSL